MLIIQILKAMAIQYFDLQNQGQLFSSLLGRSLISLVFVGWEEKSPLPHAETDFDEAEHARGQPLWTMLCKTHASCIVN